jgi:hypothetical protein
MRISVEIDPEKAEEPLVIELDSPRPLTGLGRGCPDGIRFSLL